MRIDKEILQKLHKILWVFAFISIFISGCGGGSSSSSSGGSTGSPSSTLALTNGGSGGIAAALELQEKSSVNYSILEHITHFILPSAWASINVFLNNFSYGSTDDQTLLIAVTAGSYTLRLEDDVSGETCVLNNLTIGDDQIVTVIINDVASTCDVTIQHDTIDDDLIAGGDNAPAGKTLACHKNKQIAISFNALDAHLAHGDTAGPCPVDQADNNVAEAESNKGNSNKPSKPDKPSKPKA